jgi:diacylglycerol kinase
MYRTRMTSAAEAAPLSPATSDLSAGKYTPNNSYLPRDEASAAIGEGSFAERLEAFTRGFVHAGRGVHHAVVTQRNMRVHLVLACLAVALGIAVRISSVEFALVFIAVMLVFGTEMLNTVVETVVDMITLEYHPLARVAKDVAAGAVLLNAVLAVIIALFVYVPHLWHLAILAHL